MRHYKEVWKHEISVNFYFNATFWNAQGGKGYSCYHHFFMCRYYTFLLILSWRRSPSYRNQPMDLQSNAWLLYDRDFHHETINKTHEICPHGVLSWRLVLKDKLTFIPSNPEEPCSKPKSLVGFTVFSAFHPSSFNKTNTESFW